jgi:hypothetical protein
MKNLSRTKSFTHSLVAALMFSFFALPAHFTTAHAATTATLALPIGANKTVSANLQAPAGTSVTVNVKVRNNGAAGVDPAKNVTVKLFRPSGSQVGADSKLINPGTEKTFSFSSSGVAGTSCGDWKVEVSNPGDNATNATATANASISFVPLPAITSIGPFGIVQSGDVEKNVGIPSTGSVTITATWDTDEFTPEAYKLTFRLIKPNGSQAEADTGFAQNAMFVSEGDKMKLKYTITAADIALGTNWKIKVKGSSKGKVKNVKITRAFVPGC